LRAIGCTNAYTYTYSYSYSYTYSYSYGYSYTHIHRYPNSYSYSYRYRNPCAESYSIAKAASDSTASPDTVNKEPTHALAGL
jgi:hypothetical protein